jgi:hypothetical protein
VISASQLLYEHLGKPAVEGVAGHDSEGCWMCGGESSIGIQYVDWNGSNFVGQNKIRNLRGKFVCDACVYFCQRNAEVPGRLPGKCSVCNGTLKVLTPGKRKMNKGDPCTKCDGTGMNSQGGNFRCYSHLFDSGEYVNASKGEKSAIRQFLSSSHRGPWFAAIADSGKKHVIMWAPINSKGQRGRVMFEELEVVIPKKHEFLLIDHMTDLLSAGATKESLGTGQYNPGEWMRCESLIRTFEARWAYSRNSPWWTLALWLAQRDEETTAHRLEEEKASKEKRAKGNGTTRRKNSGQTKDTNSRGAARGASSVSAITGSKHAQELGSADDSDEACDADCTKPAAVVHDSPAKPADKHCTKPKQLSLLG